jgi:hypothetical protein
MSNNSFAGINFNNPESKNIFEKQKKTMCPRYKEINENDFPIDLNIKKNDNF